MDYDVHKSSNAGHTGLTENIRRELASGEATVLELAHVLRVAPKKVLNRLRDMCVRTGGCEQVPDSWPRKYRLIERAIERPKLSKNGSGVIGLPIREGSEKPLKRDPFSHMRLCELTRK